MNRFITIAVAINLAIALILSAACKRLPEGQLNPARNKSNDQSQTQIVTQPADTVATEPVTSEAPGVIGYAVVASTGELTMSTEEWGVSTEEGSVSTEEGIIVTKEMVYVRYEADIHREPNFQSRKLESLKVGTGLILLPDTPATAEWLLVNSGRVQGYINSRLVCSNQFCISKKRSGIAYIFIRSKEMRVPQIQLEVNNIYPQQIRDLRLEARFFYHGEMIGENEDYVAAETLGIPPLLPQRSKVVYLRPYFNMPKAEVLSPENSVEVELFCAMESFNYVPCGKFKIDQMLY